MSYIESNIVLRVKNDFFRSQVIPFNFNPLSYAFISLIAIANALFWPTMTTKLFPRVTPV